MNKRERKRPEDKWYCFQGAFLRIQNSLILYYFVTAFSRFLFAVDNISLIRFS